MPPGTASGGGGASGIGGGGGGEWAIVASCRALSSGKVWVQWLGYEQERSCWRDAVADFAAPGAAEPAFPGIDSPKLLLSTTLVTASAQPPAEAGTSSGGSDSSAGAPDGGAGASGGGPVSCRKAPAPAAPASLPREGAGASGVPELAGRPVGGFLFAQESLVLAGGAAELQKKRKRWAWGGSGRRVKKRTARKEYTTRVHTIRVGKDGVVETFAVRRSGGKGCRAPLAQDGAGEEEDGRASGVVAREAAAVGEEAGEASRLVAGGGGTGEASRLVAGGEGEEDSVGQLLPAGHPLPSQGDVLGNGDGPGGGVVGCGGSGGRGGAGGRGGSSGEGAGRGADGGGGVRDGGVGGGGMGGGGAVVARTAADETAAAWEEHQKLNRKALLRPHGIRFSLQVSSHSQHELALAWTFPESSPGDCSAWIGLFDAAAFDWCRGAPRPRYVRYKPLSSAKHAGVVRWPSKLLVGLPDGEYLLSIDTGSLLGGRGAGASPDYCVSQRLRVQDGALVSVVGYPHAAFLAPSFLAPSPDWGWRNLGGGRAAPPGISRAGAAAGGARRACRAGGRGGGGMGVGGEIPRGGEACSDGSGWSSQGSDDEGGCEDYSSRAFMFAVPYLEIDGDETSEAVKRAYRLVDRLSYHDWGLCSKDGVRQAVRNAAGRAEQLPPPHPTLPPTAPPARHATPLAPGAPGVACSREQPKCGAGFGPEPPEAADASSSASAGDADTDPAPTLQPRHSLPPRPPLQQHNSTAHVLDAGAVLQHSSTGNPEPTSHLLGAGAVLPLRGALTAVTSEGYGEATCATAHRLIRLLARLTGVVPCMRGWEGAWDLGPDSSFADVGSGYGKVVIHAKLLTGVRCSHGIECVPSRVEISNLALQGLYGELDRRALDDDLLSGVSFVCSDATAAAALPFTHVYAFDRVFSEHTLAALAKVLQRSPFYVFISSKGPRLWWRHGLSKVQPVAKMRFVTTGRERCTVFIYVNAQFVPGI